MYDVSMRSRISLFSFLIIIVSLVLPSVAYAAIPFFGPIVPQAANQAICPASWGMFIIVVNNIISFAITIAIVFVAPIMIAYAGFIMMTGQGNPGEINKAKGILWNTVIGIIVALAGWLIVDAVMVVLYNPNAQSGATKLGSWSSLIIGNANDLCLSQAGALPTDKLNQSKTSDIAVVSNVQNTRTEQAIRARFDAAGVAINKSACNPTSGPLTNLCGVGTPPSCTNVEGMQEATIEQVINIAKAIGSTKDKKYITITAGTEPGHACGEKSHSGGYKVDLSLTSFVLNNYLKGMTLAGKRTGGEPGDIYWDRCLGGNQYVLTSDHWDITISSVCPLI